MPLHSVSRVPQRRRRPGRGSAFITFLCLLALLSFSLASAQSAAPTSDAARPSGSFGVARMPDPDVQIPGLMTTGAMGVRETTAQIMARDALTPPATMPRRLARRVATWRVGLPQNPDALAVASWPNPAATATSPASPQTPGTNFLGATLADTSAFPPDSMGAVGPTQFLVGVNGRIRSFNKASGTADGVLNANMDVFFNSVMTPPTATNFTSDPRVRYDRLSDRWIVIIIDVPGGTGALPNRVLLAVSDSGTLSGSTVWTFFFFQADATNFADYPTLGVDANALYIGANMFSPAGAFLNTNAYVVRKSSILGAGPIVVTTFAGLLATPSTGAGPFTPQGVDNLDATATFGYFIGVDNAVFSQLDIRRVTNPGGTPTISGNITLSVPTTAFPFTVPHLGNTGGTSGYLDALDDRLFAAMMRNGRLWTAHNINVNTSGVASGSRGRDALRWYELQNLSGTPSLVQSGTVFDSTATNPRYRWIPSVAISGQGHVAMGFSEAGAASNINAATVGRLSGDTLGTMQTVLLYTTSSTAYNPTGDPGGTSGRRWGDYSYTSVDPTDDMTIWTIQEYCNAANSYGVRVVQLLAPPPATPNATNPASVPAGQASVTVVVTGTSVSGSGFFDPGLGFSKHITAAVSGGIIVRSITYNSPTVVTLDLDTRNAGDQINATQTITVTNPDGQSRAGNLPLAILLSDFGAQAASDHVLVTWETTSELNNVGFNLWRGTSPAAPDRQLNQALIPSQAPGSANGFVYEWPDYDVDSGTTYYYWLEDVSTNGVVTRHGPVSVTFNSPTAVGLADLAAGGTALPGPLPAAGLVLLAALWTAWRYRKRGARSLLR